MKEKEKGGMLVVAVIRGGIKCLAKGFLADALCRREVMGSGHIRN